MRHNRFPPPRTGRRQSLKLTPEMALHTAISVMEKKKEEPGRERTEERGSGASLSKGSRYGELLRRCSASEGTREKEMCN
jgi:hypothetical protein